MKEREAKETFGMRSLDRIDLEKLPRALFEEIPYHFVRKNLVLPIAVEGDAVVVALADPLNLASLDELRLLLDRKLQFVLASEERILEAINSAYHHKEDAASKLISDLEHKAKESREKGAEELEVYDLLSQKDEAPIVRLLNFILSEAINQRASDIHFEPFEEDLRIRYRIDGVLSTRHAPAREYQAALLSRIKVLAKLDIAEQRLPQDGRIKVRMGGKEIDLRVSTLPAIHGERIVLRLLDKETLKMGFQELGLMAQSLKELRSALGATEGIVLVTGPTGSGKTTTLYSALSEKRSDEINIMTIEDPIEYKLSGVAQIAVHPKIGLTFAQGLRHILRQDPDVVMVGEIRDRETAEIAIQAALTGHLVLSTLHTNDAPSAITRLVDMGIEPYLLSSTLVAVLAQRLVRKICPECKESYTPSDEELAEIGLERASSEGGLAHGLGCASCHGSGYYGRIGLYELMMIDEPLQKEIAKNCDARSLRAFALKRGLITLKQHGAHLVQKQITTTAEVLRVARRSDLGELIDG